MSKDNSFWKQIQTAISSAYGVKPQTVHGMDSWRTVHYQNELLKLAKGCFEVTCRDDWDKDFILDTLLLLGHFVVTDTSLGVLPLKGQLHGNNVWHRPNKVTIANHILGNLERTIGVDCEAVYLNGSGHRGGIAPLIDLYAMRLAMCDSAWDVNMMNSKTTMVFGASNKKEADSMKAMYDEIQEGRPAVFVKNGSTIDGVTGEVYSAKAKDNFLADMISEQKRIIKEEFLTIFGVNNANTDKRERLINAEVQSNNEELMADTEWWCDNLERYCSRCNNMFGGDNHIDIRMPFRDIAVTITKDNERGGEDEQNDAE